MGNRKTVHTLILLLFVSKSCLALDNCTSFLENWEECLQYKFDHFSSCFWSDNQTVEVSETNYTIAFDCNNKPLNVEAINCGSALAPIILQIKLENCEFSNFNMKEILQEHEVKTIELVYNEKGLPVDVLFEDKPHLETVSIYGSRTGGQFQLKFGSQLPNLYVLKIDNHDFTTFVEEPFQNLSNLKSLQFRYGTLRTLQDDMFNGLHNLSKLDLSYNRLKILKMSIFENLSLYELILTGNHISYIRASPFSNIVSLEVLRLGYNNLKAMPIDFFQYIPNLRVLEVSGNKDIRALPIGVFKGMNQLENLIASNCSLNYMSELLTTVRQLDVSHNNLRGIERTTSKSLLSLAEIDVSHNPFASLCETHPLGSGTNLKKVKANSCNLTEFPHSLLSYNLSILELSGNKIGNPNLPVYTNYKTEVFLYDNSITTITLYYESMLNDAPMYYLANNTPKCDCNLRIFLGVLHSPLQKNCKFIADADSLFCSGPKKVKLVDVEWDKLMCSGKYCQSLCPCSRTVLNCSGMWLISIPSFRQGITTVHLENNKITKFSVTEFQLWDNVTHLYLSNNSMASFENWTIPQNLKTITLNNNKLRNLPSNLMETVEAKDDFKIYLADNDWRCDCKDIPFKYWFMRNKDKIKDAENTYCNLRITNDGGFTFTRSLLLNTPDSHFCQRNTALTIAIILVAMMAVILTIGFYFYFCPLKIGYFDVKR